MPEDNAKKAAIAMLDLLQRWRERAATVGAHAHRTAGGRRVSDWFATGDLREFMVGLAGDGTLVKPGRPEESTFLTVFLNGTQMAETLGSDVAVIREWVTTGAIAPEPARLLIRTRGSGRSGLRGRRSLAELEGCCLARPR